MTVTSPTTPVYFLTTTMSFFNDNRDNGNNKKNGRNCGMSRGDIQLGQQDYLCCHRFRASLLRQLLKFSLEGCTKRSGRNPGHSPGIMCDRKTVCKTVPWHIIRSEIQLGLQGLLLAACFFSQVQGHSSSTVSLFAQCACVILVVSVVSVVSVVVPP